MSLEQAILELAAAVREQTAAIAKLAARGEIVNIAHVDETQIEGRVEMAQPTPAPEPKDAEAERKEKAAAAIAQAKAAAAEHRKAEDAKKAGAAKAADKTEAEKHEEAGAPDEDLAPLNYQKDVVPVLLALRKARGDDALRQLLLSYLPDDPAPKGDKIPAKKFRKLVADAEAAIAG